MIHAYLCVYPSLNPLDLADRGGHGPAFRGFMIKINAEGQTSVSASVCVVCVLCVLCVGCRCESECECEL